MLLNDKKTMSRLYLEYSKYKNSAYFFVSQISYGCVEMELKFYLAHALVMFFVNVHHTNPRTVQQITIVFE